MYVSIIRGRLLELLVLLFCAVCRVPLIANNRRRFLPRSCIRPIACYFRFTFRVFSFSLVYGTRSASFKNLFVRISTTSLGCKKCRLPGKTALRSDLFLSSGTIAHSRGVCVRRRESAAVRLAYRFHRAPAN